MKRENTPPPVGSPFIVKVSIVVSFVLLALFFMYIFVWPEMIDGCWAQKEWTLYVSSEQEMNDLLRKFGNEKKKDYARDCVRAVSLRNNVIIQSRNIRGAYHVVILGLLNDKSSSEIIKKKLSELFCEYANCEYRDFSYGDRLTNMPVPLREYIWSLLLLEGENGYCWLKQELSKYPEISGTKAILDFACAICWIGNTGTETDLTYIDSFTAPCFDSRWIHRYVSRLHEDGFDVSEGNLVKTLKQISTPSDFQDVFHDRWRTKSAIMVLRAITADTQYRAAYPTP